MEYSQSQSQASQPVYRAKPDNLIGKMKQSWINEQTCSELLQYDDELVQECLMSLDEQMATYVNTEV